jgi:hypothetical protein
MKMIKSSFWRDRIRRSPCDVGTSEGGIVGDAMMDMKNSYGFRAIRNGPGDFSLKRTQLLA